MDIEQLKTFLAVNRCRHFGQAAQQLFVTQAAVSARIKLLEEKLGGELFVRERNNVQLTPFGQRFIGYAQHLVDTWHQACSELQVDVAQPQGLNLSASNNLWPQLAAKLNQANWSASGHMLHSHASIPEQALLNREIDFHFACTSSLQGDLKSERLGSIKLDLFAYQPNLSFKDHQQLRYILVHWSQPFVDKHLDKIAQQLEVSLRCDDITTALALLSEQMNCLYAPSLLAAHLHKVQGAPTLRQDVYLIYHPDAPKKRFKETILHAIVPL